MTTRLSLPGVPRPRRGSRGLLSTRELARLLGVSVPYLEKGRACGYGPAYIRLAGSGGVGRTVRYRRADVERWLSTDPSDTASAPNNGEVSRSVNGVAARRPVR
jgi:hypothetical protein